MRLRNYRDMKLIIYKIHAEEVAKRFWEKGKKKPKAAMLKEQYEKYGQGDLCGK